jgi:hypothetical protein
MDRIEIELAEALSFVELVVNGEASLSRRF